ncbi:chemotaxis-specific protein-glutamate methyltransferase CheB [Iningainema tapete]|uniref:Protein-glutamate methylesterase/protein-glutamine glutaminase n=1 Tax=Iningainema tapete BLCC-T55 TaxID=2748662 RepID=A0A8J7CG72_9CYAN|nr:chemotaxis-specific protein-glutamate methyltransferase CheB [Iningainema tapete]MBD2775995.1 chemotaxis-specific protein-glutamate methyltransferase CheB [Iningainema tapete BLCC-T55]
MSIKVLLVEDSQISLVILKRILNSSPQIEVVGEARTGLEGLALIPQVEPDVICTDLYMPQMDGLTFTSEVMALYPRPILVISVSVQQDNTHQVFQLLNAGAVDIFPKPSAGLSFEDEQIKQDLINKIKILSGVKVLRKKRQYPLLNNREIVHPFVQFIQPKIVVIGASTGGPQALEELFTALPSNFPVPIICVQHICVGFLQGLIDWLAKSCRLSIQIAVSGDLPKPGRIYFPPEKLHLKLDAMGRFVYSDAPPVMGHRPSITITFESVAQFYGKATMGILLTGMGRDGAQGMSAISATGGFTIAQDEATSVVFGMPKEAILLRAVKQVLPIQAIAPTLLNIFKQ